MMQPFWSSLVVSYKAKRSLTIPLDIYPNELKSYLHTRIYTQMFIDAK